MIFILSTYAYIHFCEHDTECNKKKLNQKQRKRLDRAVAERGFAVSEVMCSIHIHACVMLLLSFLFPFCAISFGFHTTSTMPLQSILIFFLSFLCVGTSDLE
jgi:hypothetical protein